MNDSISQPSLEIQDPNAEFQALDSPSLFP